jgi:hypothetical protein
MGSPGTYWFTARKVRLVCVVAAMLLAHSSHASESRTCAKNIAELNQVWGDAAFPLKWQETSMSDGKPLAVSIQEKNGKLHLQFVKAMEGLWAESTGLICPVGNELEIEFTGDEIRLGPAANWLIKLAIGSGGKFSLQRIGPHQLRIKTSGWQGLFSSK